MKITLILIINLKKIILIKKKLTLIKSGSNGIIIFCRYDSFSLIYGLIIKPTMEKENINPQNGVINYINELVNIFLNLTEDKYEEGIWNIIKINKNNLYDLTNKENCFKKKRFYNTNNKYVEIL